MAKEMDFTKCKVGTKVWSVINGKGVIVAVDPSPAYPVSVEFAHGARRRFTASGYELPNDARPSLFFRPFEIPDEAYEPVEPDPPKMTICWVRNGEDIPWVPRHFVWRKADGTILAVQCPGALETSWNYVTFENPYPVEEGE